MLGSQPNNFFYLNNRLFFMRDIFMLFIFLVRNWSIQILYFLILMFNVFANQSLPELTKYSEINYTIWFLIHIQLKQQLLSALSNFNPVVIEWLFLKLFWFFGSFKIIRLFIFKTVFVKGNSWYPWRNLFPRRNYVIYNSAIIGGKIKHIEVEI